jgi:hypothetical protein
MLIKSESANSLSNLSSIIILECLLIARRRSTRFDHIRALPFVRMWRINQLDELPPGA